MDYTPGAMINAARSPPPGLEALRASRAALLTLWDGLEGRLGSGR